jgi:hypothetical protein
MKWMVAVGRGETMGAWIKMPFGLTAGRTVSGLVNVDRMHPGIQATHIDRDIDDLYAFLALTLDKFCGTFNVVIITARNDRYSTNRTGG